MIDRQGREATEPEDNDTPENDSFVALAVTPHGLIGTRSVIGCLLLDMLVFHWPRALSATCFAIGCSYREATEHEANDTPEADSFVARTALAVTPPWSD
ncbi:hypothetical protein ACOMHN_011391 [Nucella lapillus]